MGFSIENQDKRARKRVSFPREALLCKEEGEVLTKEND